MDSTRTIFKKELGSLLSQMNEKSIFPVLHTPSYSLDSGGIAIYESNSYMAIPSVDTGHYQQV
ncbi:hypothetical protein [Spirosoma radiotolerans]|uniref:Uncharacterized protein n=1 Tax=Spirosoma radiotolerans TaxID=1379870 RepID=A0A0E3ZXX0_9BACT|nr:hypothetical protein [Spirosoma radiotolerans]AKD57160.1 hypothetical protein SD10_21950 [Spirosoma radiotolerans]